MARDSVAPRNKLHFRVTAKRTADNVLFHVCSVLMTVVLVWEPNGQFVFRGMRVKVQHSAVTAAPATVKYRDSSNSDLR